MESQSRWGGFLYELPADKRLIGGTLMDKVHEFISISNEPQHIRGAVLVISAILINRGRLANFPEPGWLYADIVKFYNENQELMEQCRKNNYSGLGADCEFMEEYVKHFDSIHVDALKFTGTHEVAP